jgi:hypothetical protein
MITTGPTFYFLEHVKIDFKNNHHMLFFPKDVITARDNEY